MGPKCSNQDELARVLSLSRIMNAKGDVEFNCKGTTQLLTKRAKTFVAPPYDTYGTDVEIRIFILKAIHTDLSIFLYHAFPQPVINGIKAVSMTVVITVKTRECRNNSESIQYPFS